MPDNSPARVVSTIDKLQAPAGRDTIALGSPIAFTNSEDKAAFITHLDLPTSTGAGGFDLDGDGDLMPGTGEPAAGSDFELDGDGDLQPAA